MNGHASDTRGVTRINLSGRIVPHVTYTCTHIFQYISSGPEVCHKRTGSLECTHQYVLESSSPRVFVAGHGGSGVQTNVDVLYTFCFCGGAHLLAAITARWPYLAGRPDFSGLNTGP